MSKKCIIKVTIMIPTYNQSAFILEAVNSALGQTYQNLEVIVGDDASKDDTSNIISKINNPKLKYVRNITNLGRSENYRNLLFNHATGDYVVNLDGDDYYTDPNFIAKAVDLIHRNDSVVIVAAKICRNTKSGDFITSQPPVASIAGLQVLKNLPDDRYYFSHMAVLYDRKQAIEIDFYRNKNLSSDWESLYRLAPRGLVCYLDSIVGVWRIHDVNESGTRDISKHFSNLEIWEIVFSEAVKFNLSPVVAKNNSARCVAAAVQYSAANISMSGNVLLIKYLYIVWKKYKLAFFFLLLTPTFFARIVASFVGHYRRKK